MRSLSLIIAGVAVLALAGCAGHAYRQVNSGAGGYYSGNSVYTNSDVVVQTETTRSPWVWSSFWDGYYQPVFGASSIRFRSVFGSRFGYDGYRPYYNYALRRQLRRQRHRERLERARRRARRRARHERPANRPPPVKALSHSSGGSQAVQHKRAPRKPQRIHLSAPHKSPSHRQPSHRRKVRTISRPARHDTRPQVTQPKQIKVKQRQR